MALVYNLLTECYLFPEGLNHVVFRHYMEISCLIF